MTLRCNDISRIFGPLNCCTSCHDDEHYYGDQYMIEKETQVEINGETKLAVICCGAADRIDKGVEPKPEIVLKKEYRVVFMNPYPQNKYVHYSAPCDDVNKLPRHAPRSDETHDYVAGIQMRTVTEWSETLLFSELKE